MKNLLFSFLLVLVFFSCKTEKQVDYAILSGKVENNGFYEIEITSLDSSFEKMIPLNIDGTFLDTLKINHSGSYLINNQIRLHLEKGENLDISFDAENAYKTRSFKGKSAVFNNYILQKEELTAKIRGDLKDFFKLDKKEYKQKVLAIRDASQELLDTLKISISIKERELRNVNYSYLNLLAQYPIFVKAGVNFEEAESEIRQLNYLNEVDYNHSMDYVFLFRRYFEQSVSEKIQQDSLSDEITFFKTASEISNETIRNSILYEKVSRSMVISKNPKDYFENFQALSTNKLHIAKITKDYQTYKLTAEGMPSANFINYENHASGHTSLTDLQGKFLYIDIWATWCSPCLREVPALKKLEKEYSDRNIEFVSISVDKKHQYQRWKKMVKDKNLGGIQLIADNAFESDFIKAFSIDVIPRFILLDTEGKILNANAPFPSDQAIHEILDELVLD